MKTITILLIAFTLNASANPSVCIGNYCTSSVQKSKKAKSHSRGTMFHSKKY